MARFAILFIPVFLFFSSSFAQTVPDSTARDSVVLKADTTVKDTTSKFSVHKKRMANRAKDSTTGDLNLPAFPQEKISEHPGKDSTAPSNIRPASSFNNEVTDASKALDSAQFRTTLSSNPDFNFTARGQPEIMEIHKGNSYDSIFYLLVGILFFFAFFKILFGKYLQNLFTLFFLVSMRQQQIREQVLQSPLPSLLLNILFVITGGLYMSFLIRFYQLAQNTDFWILFVDSVSVLSILYFGKFLFLKFSGWIFKISRVTDMYIFIIFLTNKILGIFLLPFLLILSFSGSSLREVSITVSLIMIAIFFAYRFIVSFNPVRKEIKVRGIHFLLYLCAFELAPLLLIYKVLLSYLEKTY